MVSVPVLRASSCANIKCVLPSDCTLIKLSLLRTAMEHLVLARVYQDGHSHTALQKKIA